MKNEKNKDQRKRKYKFIFISAICAIVPILVIPPIAITINKSIQDSKNNIDKNDTQGSELPAGSKKLNFNLEDKMQRNLEQYFSISLYSSEYINSLDQKSKKQLFSYYFDGVNLENWDEIFKEFRIIEFNKTTTNFIEKNSMKIYAETKDGYYFSSLKNSANLNLNWEFNNSFTLKIKKDEIINKVKEISIREEYFDDQFSVLDTLEKKFNFFNEIFKNDFSDYFKFQEAVSVFEITSNNNNNPWLNSINLKFKFKDNYKFSDGTNVMINEKIEWGYTPNATKVIFRHNGDVTNGNKQTLKALVGGLTTNKRITFKWYKNGVEIKGETSSEINFISEFKSNVIKTYDGYSFDELTKRLIDTYTVDVFYNGKKFVDHTTDSGKIQKFEFIAKPQEKFEFNINEMKINLQSIADAGTGKDKIIINKDGMTINANQKDAYALNAKYEFKQPYIYKLLKTGALKAELISSKTRFNLLNNLYEFNGEMFLEIASYFPIVDFFNKGDCYPIIRITQNYNLDIDRLLDFNLVNGTRNLHYFTLNY